MDELTEPPLDRLSIKTRVYSPVTLNNEWSTLDRLVLMVFCACFGATINGFFIGSFFVEHELARIGNVFHGCVGLSDFLITAGVIPTSAIVLLSGEWDIVPVCKALQFISASSTYCYSMFFTLTAAETYFRVCHSQKAYNKFIQMRIGLVSIILFVVGITLAGIGTYLDLEYDYCERIHYGNAYFRCITTIIFHCIPFSLTVYTLIASAIRIRQPNRLQVRYKRSIQYHRDVSMIKLNIIAYVMYVVAWTPHLVLIYLFPHACDSQYYHTAWIGIIRTLLTSVMYGSLSDIFGRAYANQFFYCCCKSSLNAVRPRHRRVEYYTTPCAVHIIQAVNANTKRGATTQETQEL